MFNETELEIIKNIIFFDEKFIFPKKDLSFYKKMYNLNLNEEQIVIIDDILEKINLFIKTNSINTRKEFEDIFDLYYFEILNNKKPFKNFVKDEKSIYYFF